MKKLRILLMVVGAALLGFLVVFRFIPQWELRSYREELRKQGEHLSVDELTPALTPVGLQAGSNLISACLQLYPISLKNSWIPQSLLLVGSNSHTVCYSALPTKEEVFPPQDGELPDGYSYGSWKALPQETNWAALEKDLQKNAETFHLISLLLQQTNLRLNTDPRSLLGMGQSSQSNLVVLQHALIALDGVTLVQLRQGNFAAAQGAAQDALRLYRVAEHQTLVKRSSSEKSLLVAGWELLQYDNWTDEQLRQLQNGWEDPDPWGPELLAMQMDRAMVPLVFDNCRRRWLEVPVCAFGEEHPEEWPGYCLWCFTESYTDERVALTNSQIWLNALREIRGGKPAFPVLAKAGNAQDVLRARYRSSQGFQWGSASLRIGPESRRRLMFTAIALKRFYLQNKVYPANLEELAPAYLSVVPLDPMDGKPLRYRSTSKTDYLLYALGCDGKDHGGTAKESFMYRDWLFDQDFVWPQRATSSEVEAYRAKSLSEGRILGKGYERTRRRPPIVPTGTNN